MLVLLFVCAAFASPMFGRNLMDRKTDVSAKCFVCRVVVQKARELAPEAAKVAETLDTQVCGKVFSWMKQQVRALFGRFFFF
jgi:hypothetical protein